MATKLEPFTPEASCPKCGFQGIRNVWKAAKTCLETCHDDEHNAPEHILRVCQSCGFNWKEAPLDR